MCGLVGLKFNMLAWTNLKRSCGINLDVLLTYISTNYSHTQFFNQFFVKSTMKPWAYAEYALNALGQYCHLNKFAHVFVSTA